MKAVEAIRERYKSLDYGQRKTIGIALCIAMSLLTAYSLAFSYLETMETRRGSREKVLAEMLLLQQRHREASATAQRVANRLSAVTAEDSPALLIEQSGITAQGGVQSKPLPRQEKNGVIEEGAELTVSGLSANELVNLLHRLEQHQKPVVVRRVAFKTRFNDPARIDAVLTLALLKPGRPAEQK